MTTNILLRWLQSLVVTFRMRGKGELGVSRLIKGDTRTSRGFQTPEVLLFVIDCIMTQTDLMTIDVENANKPDIKCQNTGVLLGRVTHWVRSFMESSKRARLLPKGDVKFSSLGCLPMIDLPWRKYLWTVTLPALLTFLTVRGRSSSKHMYRGR